MKKFGRRGLSIALVVFVVVVVGSFFLSFWREKSRRLKATQRK
jgi:hypothetical protein